MTGYVCLLLLLAVTTVTPAFWDCRNPGLSCHGGTCLSTGKCDCSSLPEKGGYDCNCERLFQHLVDDCSTDKEKCENGASCYDMNPGDKTVACYCPPGFYGTYCTENRFSVDCESSSMTVTVKLEFTANGGAYVLGKTGCALVYDSTKGLFSMTINNKGDTACGDINGESKDGKTTYTRKVIVQQRAKILTTSDFIVTFTCTFDSKETVVTHSVTTVKVDEDVTLGDAERSSAFGSVSLVANPSDKALSVGQIVKFTLSGDSDVKKLFITKIAFSANDQTEEKIFDAGCPLVDSNSFIADPLPATMKKTPNKAEAWLFVVKYRNSDDLKWSFTVRTCLEDDLTPCQAIACMPTLNRRRRAAEPDVPDNTTEVVNYQIKVVETVQELAEKRQSECETSNKMTAAVVAMAVACFILLVICLVLIARAFSHRRYLSESKQSLS